MNYIVMDLEWNQPLSYADRTYQRIGDRLVFELLQIGAVRLDSDLNITDTFSRLIRPSCYTKLHPRIRRITHIEPEDLDDAPGILEVLEEFDAFCGPDSCLLTWGCDDVSVLEQNKQYFHADVPCLPVYDLQSTFGEIIGNAKERKALHSAMEYYQIEPEEDRPFHDALNDAYYTSRVFSLFPSPESVLGHPLHPKPLRHVQKGREFRAAVPYKTGFPTFLRTASAATAPPCPVCGHKTPLSAGYVQLDASRYQALAECGSHGLIIVTMEKLKTTDGKRAAACTCVLSPEQSKAYISTKLLQWKNKLAMQA